MGKTTSFKQEATYQGGQYVTARDFITFDIKPEWQNKTLFIDGLDEVRAGKGDVFSSFDEIRKKLEQLGRPHFRLSCREADWYGVSDREELKKVSPDGEIKELFFVELTEEDLRQILIENHSKTDSEASSFLEHAKHRELADLIKNPQILGMLVTVVGSGNGWPERKSDIFKLACEKLLLEEWNKTHNTVNRYQTPPSEDLMRASGMLCAVMLLARKQGCTSIRSNADEDYPYITDMAIDRLDHLDLAARTRLFSTRDGHTEYGHRVFAEYLSAYYLSNRIDNEGLPVGRALALMTGTDGGVVAELRGVYAWLATLCKSRQTILIARDPLGIVLYGDVSMFSKQERLELLHELSALAEKADDSGITYENRRLFGAFCQADMQQDFQRILESTDRFGRHQYVLEYVLASMVHGHNLQDLSDVVVSLLYDNDLKQRNRTQALEILIRFGNEQVLRQILTDLALNRISDPDDDFMGTLLCSMYPHQITPSEVFNYLSPGKKPNLQGSFFRFWFTDLTEKANDNQVAELLDALVQKQPVLDRNQDNFICREMAGKLLARGIHIFDDNIEIERLYGWLSLGRNQHGSISLRGQDGPKKIGKWLEEHPQLQKNLVEYHLDNNSKENRRAPRAVNIHHLLFYAEPPEDYGRWCLGRAIAANDESARKGFFSECIWTLINRQGNAGLSLELLEDAAAKDSLLKTYWREHNNFSIPPDYYEENQEVKQLRAKQDQEKNMFLQSVRNNLKDIETGSASSGIFKNLGSAYYGYFIDSTGNTPGERLGNFFENDFGLIRSVLKGLIHFIHRADIPEVTDIIRTHMNGKYYVHSYPYRAGMDEMVATDLQQTLALSEDKIAKALAFNYVDGTGQEPVWYKTLLEQRPILVARIYIYYATMVLRSGKAHITGTYALAFDKNHQQVAHIATLPLLNSFRVRRTQEQLAPLYDLLAAALQHADHTRFEALVEKKLSRNSMDTAQRTLWLTAGLILDPDQYESLLIEFVAGKDARINYLCGLLSHHGAQWSPVDRLPLRTVTTLTRLLGSRYAPIVITDDDYMDGTSSSTLSKVIFKLICRLVTFHTDEATGEIESLLHSDELSNWHPRLRQALHTQRTAKREAVFRHVSAQQVIDTLNNGLPANVADLASITCEHIRELADQIRNGNTNDYRQYWKEYPSKREREDDCRDRFLSDLKPLLKHMNFDALPEGRSANDGRVDIRVSLRGDFNVPVEIKCSDSKDLWHNIRTQLIDRYVIDPGTQGYGIYLIFWFGADKVTPPPNSGSNPKTPVELEERLRDLLETDEERKKISVCVVDCTAPTSAGN
ncbi:MAG: hypothetical protein OXI88_19775 [Gammaproteobacteria bacterium]|nr:hypothetical protein [Gammaproteobacteria bacterium]